MRATARIALIALTTCAPNAPNAKSVTRADAPPVGAANAIVADAGSGDARGADASDSMPTLDALAARAPSVAAGMREVARGEIAGDASGATRIIARAEDHDACVRVALIARPAVRAWLADSRGDALAEARDMQDAALGAHGPVCVRKGDAVALHVESRAEFVVRFVGWQSP